jgi:cytochrome c-type biogenesis protein CcmH/NrfG
MHSMPLSDIEPVYANAEGRAWVLAAVVALAIVVLCAALVLEKYGDYKAEREEQARAAESAAARQPPRSLRAHRRRVR